MHPQPYKSLSALREAFPGLHFPRPYTWRLLGEDRCCHGKISGLISFQGLAVASNGIYLALIDELGNLRFGHENWFERDLEEMLGEDLSQVKTERKTKRQIRMEEYV